VKKVPDIADHFTAKAKNLLTDRNHGVLLTAITLVTEMIQIDASILEEFRSAVPLLVRNLKSLVTTGYSPEHDVSGITDPFLQVKVLRLLRLLGKGDEQASETMNDILAQVSYILRVREPIFMNSGRDQHRFLQKRWKFYPLRNRPDRAGN
jgi:AP-1 complex subunit gamma-1